jgi:hypothetical protein
VDGLIEVWDGSGGVTGGVTGFLEGPQHIPPILSETI